MAPQSVPALLREALRAGPPVLRYRLALSGGADSSALLRALLALPELAGRLDAVHVDHGLHPDSGRWAERCARGCAALGVPLRIERVTGRPGPGESIEAWARAVRYRCLAALTASGEAVLTAHHCEDQAETLLLQLLRGAGPHGLGGIAPVQPLGAGWLLRPLLSVPRAALRAWGALHETDVVEDPANLDPRYDRTFLRARVFPLLGERWPAAAATLARAAALQREACAVLDEVCDLALASLEDAGGALDAHALRRRPDGERRWILRRWLWRHGAPLPQARHLRELERLTEAAASSGGCVGWPGAQVRRYRDRLHLGSPGAAEPAPGTVLSWQPEQPLLTPWGRLSALPCLGAGLSRERCAGGPWEVRFRRGGERCRPAGRGGRSAPLKKVLQELGVAPWLRQRLPLLYVGGELAAVADRLVCAPFAARAGEPGWRIEWSAAQPPED